MRRFITVFALLAYLLAGMGGAWSISASFEHESETFAAHTGTTAPQNAADCSHGCLGHAAQHLSALSAMALTFAVPLGAPDFSARPLPPGDRFLDTLFRPPRLSFSA
ncbi:MAG: hypothetical protein AB7O31_18275 [Burkholderiales bacterium]